MPRTKRITDDAVLDAVARMITRHGPHALTLAHVGREVGLHPATLLQRFGSKKKLLRAFGRRSAASAPALFANERASPLAALRASLHAMAAPLADRRTLPNNVAMLLEDLRDPALARSAGRQAASIEREITARLDEAVAARELRAADTGALARTIHAAWNGAVITWALHGRGSLERWIDAVLDPLLTPRRAAGRFRGGPRSA